MTYEECQERVRRAKMDLQFAKKEGNPSDIQRREEDLEAAKERLVEVRDKTTERYSTGMFVGGIIGICAGGGAVLTGVALTAVTSDDSTFLNADSVRTATVATVIGGLVLAGVGIPLALVGGRRIKKEEKPAEARPTLILGPQGAAVRALF
jgi:NhaP-type Na+/H+ or K+/H+ antiporter